MIAAKSGLQCRRNFAHRNALCVCYSNTSPWKLFCAGTREAAIIRPMNAIQCGVIAGQNRKLFHRISSEINAQRAAWRPFT